MTKKDLYEDIRRQILAVVEGETSHIARYATACSLLHSSFDDFFWTGFYLVDPNKRDELVIGPYQGSLGCLRIKFGKGVCGTAAESGETVIVEDVHAFPGHIACDARSNSEIVVPVFDDAGKVVAVLDVDSEKYAAFDQEDKAGLEAICRDLLSV